MTQPITVHGLIATTPRHIKTQDGLDITSFRLASSERQFDHNQKRWLDGETNWYTITSFKQLALNTHKSVNKGDRVIISGNLRIRDWDNGERAGTSVEIEADSLGHDLSWGESVFNRTILFKDLEPERNEYLEQVKQELAELKQTLAELSEA
jgi:single-strand DNA-binding protein